MISSRKDFFNPEEHAATVQLAEVKADGNFYEERDPSFKALKNKRILVLVHGYNMNERDAVDAYHKIRGKMNSTLAKHGMVDYDAVIGYLWPGGKEALSYYSAKENVAVSASHLQSQLEKLCSLASRVDVMAHSMGNRVVLEAMGNMEGKKPIRNFYSFAAALDDEAVQKDGRYAKGIEKCKRVFALHSREDHVLKYLYLIAELDRAFGYDGAEDNRELAKHVQLIDCTEVVGSHSKYRSTPEVYAVIKKILLNQLPNAQKLRVLPGGKVTIVSGDRRSYLEILSSVLGSIFN